MNCCNDYGRCTGGQDCPARSSAELSTRKYPRTLQEAFGPYTSQRIDDQPAPMAKADKIVLVASILALVAVICMAAAGWLPGSQA